MSKGFVNAGRRRSFTPSVAYKAGDLAYHQGFYGIVQDDVAAGELGVLVLDAGVQELKNIFGSNIPPGTTVYAAPSVMATSLLVYPAASFPSGANPIGRVWATTTASLATAVAKVAMFHPNQY